MSEISEKAIKLIKDLRRDISIDIMFTPEKNAENNSLKALTDYIAELEAAQRWIPVSERLPDTGKMLKYYDVIVEGEDSVAVALWDGWYKNWNLYEAGDGYVSTTLVTHWRERPTLPEVQE